jgi:hypothetical protein
VLFGHGEDVSACTPDCHPVVLQIGQARTRTRSKFRPHSMLTVVVVDVARPTEEITVRDVFEEVDPVRLCARSTAVYTSNGALRAQLNAMHRSAKVFATDILVFENDLGFSYTFVHRNTYDRNTDPRAEAAPCARCSRCACGVPICVASQGESGLCTHGGQTQNTPWAF